MCRFRLRRECVFQCYSPHWWIREGIANGFNRFPEDREKFLFTHAFCSKSLCKVGIIIKGWLRFPAIHSTQSEIGINGNLGQWPLDGILCCHAFLERHCLVPFCIAKKVFQSC
jgi:hypothetical protein